MWDIMYGPIATDESNFVSTMWESRHDKPPESVLDIGCGTGRYVVPLSQKGWKVTGIDSSESMLKVLLAKASRHDVQPEIFNSDFREFETDRIFDLVIAFFMMIYLCTDEEAYTFFKRVHALIRPGGMLLVNFFNAYAFWHHEEWNSGMARRFKGGHLKVEYRGKPKDWLRGVADTEDFRRFSQEGKKPLFDLSSRPMRFQTPETIRLFLKRTGFTDITLHPGFRPEALGPGDTKGNMVIAAATRA